MTVSDLSTDPMFKLTELCARWFNAIIMGVVAATVFHDAVSCSSTHDQNAVLLANCIHKIP